MKKIIRLTESQLHNLIVEALLESAMEMDWSADMKAARNNFYERKKIEEKHDKSWQKHGDGSEEYQRYLDLWDEYCNLVFNAQEKFLAQHSKEGAKREGKVKISPRYYELNLISEDKGKYLIDENKRFLYDQLFYLADYTERKNQNPNYKYLVAVEMGKRNGITTESKILSCTISPIEKEPEKEWDLTNYTPIETEGQVHGYKQNRSDMRGAKPRYRSSLNKDLGINQLDKNTNYPDKDTGQVITPDNDNYNRQKARTNILNIFGDNAGNEIEKFPY